MASSIGTTFKATFTFDEITIRRLDEAAARLARPKSQIVRDAVTEYFFRMDRLSDRERESMLRAFDELAPQIPTRARAELDRELQAVRTARPLEAAEKPVTTLAPRPADDRPRYFGADRGSFGRA